MLPSLNSEDNDQGTLDSLWKPIFCVFHLCFLFGLMYLVDIKAELRDMANPKNAFDKGKKMKF
jgi:hypothetical protein